MRVCPKCNAHYENDMFFCLNDGTPLNQTDEIVVKESFPGEDNENKSEETLVISSESDDIKTVQPLDQIDNKSEETFIKTPEKDSEVTVIRKQENKSEPTVIRSEQKDSEVTVIRPQQKDSEVTVVREQENQPEKTVYNSPQNESEVTVIRPQKSKKKTSDKPPLKNEMFSLQTDVSSAKENRNHIIKTAGLGALVFVLIVGACGIAAYLESQISPALKNLSSSDTDNQTDLDETSSDETANDFPIDSADAEPSKTPQETTQSTPLPTENPAKNEDKPAEKSSYKEGKITGKLIYPGEGIPPNMHLCLVDIQISTSYCSNEKTGKSFFDIDRSKATYTAYATPGTYYIYARVSGKKERAYYTEFIPCGMGVNCQSHKKIPIRVKNKETVKGIDVGDWYDFK